jgi:four helix bundle protein
MIADCKFEISNCQEMTPDELRTRTKQFALRIIRLVGALPKNIEGRAIANQLVRCGTSVAVNYRAACRARSRPEFVAKMGECNRYSTKLMSWLQSLSQRASLPLQI